MIDHKNLTGWKQRETPIEKKPCKYCGGEGQWKKDPSVVFDMKDEYVECTKCGRRTELTTMPWLAWELFNAGKVINGEQMTIFDLRKETNENN